MNTPHFNIAWLTRLLRTPKYRMLGKLGGHNYSARIVIPDYRNRITEHYRQYIPGDLQTLCQETEIPVPWQHFGVAIDFEDATELLLYDDHLVLDAGLRHLIATAGSVILTNVYMNAHHRSQGHRNRFPHLNFHVDRSANQPTHYSLYVRDPFDGEQKHPRTSSTLFISNIVAHLQGVKEGAVEASGTKGARPSTILFEKENVPELIGNVILEHAWDKPTGTGEVSMLDNLFAQHASYYREPLNKGYKIGVRYLASKSEASTHA